MSEPSKPNTQPTLSVEVSINQAMANTAAVPALEPNLGTEIVIVRVGRKRKEFAVHKKLLCESATMFNGAFGGPFIEGQERTMTLEDESAGGFALYVEWIHRSSVRMSNTERHLHDLYDLYILAEKLCLPQLKDQIMDTIHDMARKYNLLAELCTPTIIKRVWANTSPSKNREDRGLTRFILYMAAYVLYESAGPLDEEDSCDESDSEPDEFKSPTVEDLMSIWNMAKEDFDFFKKFRSNILFNWGFPDRLCDPGDRDENNSKGRCWFHCHKSDQDCRRKEEESSFIPDTTATETADVA